MVCFRYMAPIQTPNTGKTKQRGTSVFFEPSPCVRIHLPFLCIRVPSLLRPPIYLVGPFSAGFFQRATGQAPRSGTAVANLLPATVEASLAQAPLLEVEGLGLESGFGLQGFA